MQLYCENYLWLEIRLGVLIDPLGAEDIKRTWELKILQRVQLLQPPLSIHTIVKLVLCHYKNASPMVIYGKHPNINPNPILCKKTN